MSATKLTIVQGDDKSWPITFTDSAGDPVDLTGSTFSGKFKKEFSTPDADAVSFTFTDVDLANGQFTMSLAAADTAALTIKPTDKSFVFDAQVTYSGGQVETFMRGYLIINPEVTV